MQQLILLLFTVYINTFRSFQSHVFENKHISKMRKRKPIFSCMIYLFKNKHCFVNVNAFEAFVCFYLTKHLFLQCVYTLKCV